MRLCRCLTCHDAAADACQGRYAMPPTPAAMPLPLRCFDVAATLILRYDMLFRHIMPPMP